MIIIGLTLVGAVLGGVTAKKRNGTWADIAQYVAGYGIAFALVGVVATLILHRLAL